MVATKLSMTFSGEGKALTMMACTCTGGRKEEQEGETNALEANGLHCALALLFTDRLTNALDLDKNLRRQRIELALNVLIDK